MQALRRAVVLCLPLLAAGTTLSHAQTYPNRPVRMIVAFSAGGPTDVLARVVAEGMSRALGQQVIIDNKPGAGGMLGTREAAKATPDGYTLLFAGDAALTVQPQLSRSAGYDGQRDFTPLRVVASQTNVLMAHRAKGLTDLRRLVERARAAPGTISFGSAGNGTPSHLIGALFETRAGIELLHVPYKGAAPAMTDLIGGQIDLMFVGMPVAKQNSTRSELVPLAVTGDERSPTLPAVPTFAQAGVPLPGTDTTVWWGIAGPAGLSAQVKAKLEASLDSALQDPAVRNGLASQGVDRLNLDERTMRQWIVRDAAKWRELIAAGKISTD